MSDISKMIYTTLTQKYTTSTLTKKQAATELQIGQSKLDQLRASGELKFVRVGRQIRFRLTDLAEFLA